MGIGRLYYYAISFLLCGLYAQSHFESWPESGWGPHKGFKNQYRNDPNVKAAAAARKAAEDADKLAEEVAEIIHDYEQEADRTDRKTRRARARSRRRGGESDGERARRKRKERERAEELAGVLEGARRRAERKIRRYERKRNEWDEKRQGNETLERARERSWRKEREREARGRKRKRGRSVESGPGVEDESEPAESAPPPTKRQILQEPADDDKWPGENGQITDDTQSGNPAQSVADQEGLQISFGSGGLPQLSTGIEEGGASQDAVLAGGQAIPPRPSKDHASDHESSRPLPRSVREELLRTRSDNNTPNRPETPKKPFSLLIAFCRKPELLLTFVSYLPLPSLISLYAISKTFHYLFNRHHTAFILSSMRTWAPGADTIYPWRCYKSLCTNDPQLRQKMKYHGLDEEEAVFRLGVRGRDMRDVPTLRWLQMVVWREGVCTDMMMMLATRGLWCPRGTLDAVKRMWFILDLPLNAHRIALIQTPAYISSTTLLNMTAFLLKVDMAFTHPDAPAYPANHPGLPAAWANHVPTGVPLRKLLLSERQLTPLWRVLRGWTWDPSKSREPLTDMEALRLWVRHRFTIPADAPEDWKDKPIMDLPWHAVGTASMERTGLAFYTLDGKKVPITHPAIMSREAYDTHQGKQLLYPHRRVIHLPDVLDKARERLLRPDELVLREGVRRQMQMHERWVHLMLGGFIDPVGFTWPNFTEAELRALWRGKQSMKALLKEKRERRGEKGLAEMDLKTLVAEKVEKVENEEEEKETANTTEMTDAP